MLKLYVQGEQTPTETQAEKREKKLAAAAKGLLMALRAAREAKDPELQKDFLRQARRFKAYMERLGKNK